MVNIRSRYQSPQKSVVSFDGEVTKTQNYFAKEANINYKTRDYDKNGLIGNPLARPTKAPMFGDFVNMSDFQQQQDKIAFVYNNFSLLPSNIRKRFGNNPVEMVEFLNDPDNRSAAVKMGLLPSVEEKTSSVGGDSTVVDNSSSSTTESSTSAP